MNVLIVGTGSGGSWQVRGVQLGRAIGARVRTQPTEQDWTWADLVVLVKRAIQTHGDLASSYVARANGSMRLVWDAVDFWVQPDDNQLALSRHVDSARGLAKLAGVDLMIGATRAMADAVGGVYLPHHSRPGLMNTPTRPICRTLAYEGKKKYLGPWAKALIKACAALDLNLLINPPDLRDADLVVAFRGAQWEGDVCREWKSGVKIVNAIAAGRPVLSRTCAAFSEIRPVGITVDDPSELDAAIASWMPYARRDRARIEHESRAREFDLGTVARQYHQILDRAWEARGMIAHRPFSDYEEYVYKQGGKARGRREHLLAHVDSNTKSFAKTFKRAASHLKSGPILCLGARTGAESVGAEQAGFKGSVGIDLHPVGPTVRVGDWHDLQFPDQSFANVYSNSLDHCLYLDKLAAGVKRVLMQGGRFYVMASNREGATVEKWKEAWSKSNEGLFWSHSDELRDAICAYGFTTIKSWEDGKWGHYILAVKA